MPVNPPWKRLSRAPELCCPQHAPCTRSGRGSSIWQTTHPIRAWRSQQRRDPESATGKPHAKSRKTEQRIRRSIRVLRRRKTPQAGKEKNRSTITATGTRRTRPGVDRLRKRKPDRGIPIARCPPRERSRAHLARSPEDRPSATSESSPCRSPGRETMWR